MREVQLEHVEPRLRRHFIGWGRTALRTTATLLADRYATDAELRMDAATVVLPGARATRRLKEQLLEEVKATGDIFFPTRWLSATLGGHASAEAASVVRGFLREHPEYPPRLLGKILQEADPLFRAAARHGAKGGEAEER